MFVTALFNQAIEPNAVLVPQQAVQRDFDGSAFVYLVGKDNKVVRRKVDTKRTAGTNWVISAGIKAGDRIITQGIGNLRSGMPVRPVPASSVQRIGAAGREAAQGK